MIQQFVNFMTALLLTKFILNDVPHAAGMFTNPQYGPPETAAPEVKEIWRIALKETKTEYPIGHPSLVTEAKRAGKSQEEMQMMIAHETYLDRRRTLLETWAGEYDEVEEFEEEEEEEE